MIGLMLTLALAAGFQAEPEAAPAPSADAVVFERFKTICIDTSGDRVKAAEVAKTLGFVDTAPPKAPIKREMVQLKLEDAEAQWQVSLVKLGASSLGIDHLATELCSVNRKDKATSVDVGFNRTTSRKP